LGLVIVSAEHLPIVRVAKLGEDEPENREHEKHRREPRRAGAAMEMFSAVAK
jgi:hypothetical protein